MTKKQALSDSEVLENIRRGDRDMLVHLYERNRNSIRNLLRKNSGNDHDAEDILQDSVIVVWQQAQKSDFSLSSKLDTYIYAVARNLWLKQLRKNKNMVNEAEMQINEKADHKDSFSENDSGSILIKYVKMLSDSCRDVLSLFYFDGLEMEEIALRLNFANADTVKAKKYQCKKKLEDLIKRDFIKEDLL